MARWSTPFGLPPFARIEPNHFRPAFAAALKAHKAEITKIARDPARPTFANTIAALEKSGRLLERVCGVFFNLAAADTNFELQAIEREISPRLAAHQSAIMLNGKLFARIDNLYGRRDRLRLSDEQRRVLELQHTWFLRAGAKLGRKAKTRVAEINERLATLATEFSQNVLKDEQSWHLVLEGERDLAGLPSSVRAAAARAAADMGLNGQARHHAVALERGAVPAILGAP